VQAEGDVRFGDAQLEVSGTLASFDSARRRALQRHPRFKLKDVNGRGAAKQISRIDPDVTILEGVTYTTCSR
jgi:lipopolysaccharide assembly outer membrane protein LptD (OstA)